MTGKIFRYAFSVGALALLLCALLFFGLRYRQTIDDAYETLRQETVYVSRGVALEGMRYLEALDADKRITWIDASGEVLYDSQSPALPNQEELPEVRAARQNGVGQAIRPSGSEGVTNMYYARRLEDGSVLRLSNPVSAVREALIAVSPVLWIFVLVLSISGVLAFRAAKQIVRPVNEMDLDQPSEREVYPELAPLVSRLQEQRLTIRDQIEELHTRQKEFSALTDNMTEGFLLLDRQGRVVSVNATARLLLPEAKPGEALPSYADAVSLESAEQALKGSRGEAVFTRNDRNWQLVASPVRSRGQIVGAVLLWLDVTEREQRERLRKEFSANVSHELKTPLTSISGFAELMAQGTVPPDKVAEFSADIQREAQRLINLVEDIIKLSKLDENARLPAPEPVDLLELSEDVLDSLRAVADKGGVSLQSEGEPAEVLGVWQLLSEMVYNLCDNAVKYNKPGGSVTVTVGHLEGCPFLRVSDTGIGIPEQEQSRVFERFYRVDKSHSKRIGGTGLGLSIVKHGAQYHDARLSLESKPGQGTAVSLVFPKQISRRAPSDSRGTAESPAASDWTGGR